MCGRRMLRGVLRRRERDAFLRELRPVSVSDARPASSSTRARSREAESWMHAIGALWDRRLRALKEFLERGA
jgi:hypothetical protein